MTIFDRWKAICGGSRSLAWLMVINVAVWLIVTILRIPLSPLPVNTEPWLSLPSSMPVFLSRPWTLLTYMVVQYDFLHLLFNVLWLYWFGIIILTALSDRHLLWLYIGGGLCGGLFFLACSALGWGGGLLCGSSASVLAVMSAAAIRMPDYRLNLFLIGPVALKWVALVCCVLTFLGGGGNQPAHLGGLIWGIFFALLIRRGVDLSALTNSSTLAKLFPKRSFAPAEPYSRNRSASKVVDAFERRRRDAARLDELLDKIRISGYESLSRRERSELQTLSSRLKNKM